MKFDVNFEKSFLGRDENILNNMNKKYILHFMTLHVVFEYFFGPKDERSKSNCDNVWLISPTID